jgi:Transposase
MKKARFSERQIIEILELAEARTKVADLCRKHGISQCTFYQRVACLNTETLVIGRHSANSQHFKRCEWRLRSPRRGQVSTRCRHSAEPLTDIETDGSCHLGQGAYTWTSRSAAAAHLKSRNNSSDFRVSISSSI